MIINNSAYLNYLTTLGKPSNDVNAADTGSTKDTDGTDTANQTTANTPVTLPANMDSLDITSSSTTEVEQKLGFYLILNLVTGKIHLVFFLVATQ